jgi:catechol 2,3-dioxygenase-like lactoylglutathione lyase family enzyme
MRAQPLIAVNDVEASSRWYQRLLGCRSNHEGSAYEQLVSNGQLVLQLHSFEAEHHHGRIGNPDDKPYGNGVLLWFEVDDFDAVMQRASEIGVDIVIPRHRNPPEGDGGPNHWECWMRDPDGYVVVAASPYGTADGAWRPGEHPFGV